MFDSRKLNTLINRGCEAVRFSKGFDKQFNDSFIVDEMTKLSVDLGDEVWTAETLRRWRGASKRRTPISTSILNKFVYVCLAEAGGLLQRQWATAIFAANDMEAEDMHPQLLKLLDDLDFKEAQLPPRKPATQAVSPLQRPSRVSHFVGRDWELEAVMNGLQRGGVVTIWGPGGIGKSVLAAAVVWRLTKNDSPPPKFPDGVVYYNFYNQPEVELALEHIALSFQVEPRPTPRSAARRALSGRKVLLVLDGTEVADNPTNILEIATDCGVLITTRQKLDGAGTIIELGTLPVDDAVRLFQKPIATKMDEDTLVQICRLLDGLPLAVQLASRYVAATGERVANYLDWLDQSPLAALHHGEREHQSISVLLHKSLQQISERARQVFVVSGMLAPTSFAADPVAAALEHSLVEVRAALNELLLFGLLQRDGNRYQVGHLLIYTYAHQHYSASVRVVRKLVEYFANLGLAQIGRGDVGFGILADEHRHCMQLLTECNRRNEWEAVQWLTKAYDEYLDLRGYWTDRVTALEAAFDATQGLNDMEGQLRWLCALGDVYTKQGDFSKAKQVLHKAEGLALKSDNLNWYATSRLHLGNLFYATDEPILALGYYKSALMLFQTTDNERLAGVCLGHIGLAYQQRGEFNLAIEHLQKGLASTQKYEDFTSENRFLSGLGLAFVDVDEPHKAIDYHKQALEVAKKLGDLHAQCVDLGNLGIALFYAHRPEDAFNRLAQALMLARQTGDEVNQARWLVQLGRFYRDTGNVDQAVEFYTEVLPLLERLSPTEAEQVRFMLEDILSSDNSVDALPENK